jgi:hypothetical protein
MERERKVILNFCSNSFLIFILIIGENIERIQVEREEERIYTYEEEIIDFESLVKLRNHIRSIISIGKLYFSHFFYSK